MSINLHPTVEDVPTPDIWYCTECGNPSMTLVARLLGGWATIRCAVTRKPVTGSPTRPVDVRGHLVPKSEKPR